MNNGDNVTKNSDQGDSFAIRNTTISFTVITVSRTYVHIDVIGDGGLARFCFGSCASGGPTDSRHDAQQLYATPEHQQEILT